MHLRQKEPLEEQIFFLILPLPSSSSICFVANPVAATTAAPVPFDEALYGSKSGKGAKAKSVKRTTESGKALPVKNAKAEKDFNEGGKD